MSRFDDIVAWHYDGECYCPDCKPVGDDDPELSPVFSDDEEGEIGATCNGCRMCFVAMGDYSRPDWLSHEDATGPDVRWANCKKCNHSEPHYQPSAKKRLAALRQDLTCRSCHHYMSF